MTGRIIATAGVIAICGLAVAQANQDGGTKYQGIGTDDPDMFVKLIKFPKQGSKAAYVSVFKARKVDYVCDIGGGQTQTAQEQVTLSDIPVKHQRFSAKESGWEVKGKFGHGGTVSGSVSKSLGDSCVADEAWTAAVK